MAAALLFRRSSARLVLSLSLSPSLVLFEDRPGANPAKSRVKSKGDIQKYYHMIGSYPGPGISQETKEEALTENRAGLISSRASPLFSTAKGDVCKVC